MKTFDTLSETLGLPKMPEVETKGLPMPIEDTGVDVRDDYELTRDTLRNLIGRGNDALELIMQIASASEHPRSVEVAGGMINTVANTAKQLIELQKMMKDLNKGTPEAPVGTIQTQNNIVFQGTTADLLKQIRNDRVIDQDASE